MAAIVVCMYVDTYRMIPTRMYRYMKTFTHGIISDRE